MHRTVRGIATRGRGAGRVQARGPASNVRFHGISRYIALLSPPPPAEAVRVITPERPARGAGERSAVYREMPAKRTFEAAPRPRVVIPPQSGVWDDAGEGDNQDRPHGAPRVKL